MTTKNEVTPNDIDKRHNNDSIDGDVAIDEINYFIDKYTKLVDSFEAKRKKNELVSFLSLIFTFFSVCLIYSPFLFGLDILENTRCRLLTSLLFSISALVLFLSCLVNRLKGYTRAWSRNRLMKEQLEILAREYRLSIRGKKLPTDRQYINIEQENILSKLFELESKNRIETHADIVGDYIAAHEGVFGWVKGLRK